jgi:tRNA modification GTPase
VVLSKEVHRICRALIDLRMLVEATLDFPDEEIDFLERGARHAAARAGRRRTASPCSIARARAACCATAFTWCWSAQPNVGKSSLLNQLAGEERAIVTDIAGTTRDALRETIQIEGIPLHIIDTAGLRETSEEVERIGIERTWREIERADVILRLVDVRAGLTEADADIDARLPAGVERITVFNKIDLLERQPERMEGDRGVSLLPLGARPTRASTCCASSSCGSPAGTATART